MYKHGKLHAERVYIEKKKTLRIFIDSIFKCALANYSFFFFLTRLDLKEVKCQENSHLSLLICNAFILKSKHSTLAKLQLLLAMLLLNVKGTRFHW